MTSPPQSASLDDVVLVGRCLRQDDNAWELIVARYKKRVLHMAYKFTGRHDAAEDLMQEIFLRVFNGLARFDQNASFSAWLMSVARHHCIDNYRARKRAREVSLEDQAELRATESAASPFRRLEERDRREILREALSRMPEKLRQVIILRDLMELSYEEIGSRLGLPEGTLKSRLSRGRSALARRLLTPKRKERPRATSACGIAASARRRSVNGA
ncbi:MAG: RNA polymerase sigma factor [Vicinamibacteria bacterium]|nr:RNA polymerase sigma factor [Vicinamibacteria bacterium]